MTTSAAAVIEALEMQAHPEGGWYAETWRATAPEGVRPSGSAILYLLAAGERSHWHRFDADEVWAYSAGGPLELRVWAEGEARITIHRLGPEVAHGEVVQAIVPTGTWQTARPLGPWTLVGCIVTPAFEFAGFELAAEGWEPPIVAAPPETPSAPP